MGRDHRRPAGAAGACEGNLAAIAAWVERTPWVDFLVEDPKIRSCTSVCLKIVAAASTLPSEQQWARFKKIEALLDAEGVAYDIAGHRDAVPGLRIWCGATIERSDVEALLPWLDWAFAEANQAAAAAETFPLTFYGRDPPCRKS